MSYALVFSTLTFKPANAWTLLARYVLDNGKVAVTVDAAWDIPKIRRYVEKKELRPALSALPLHHASFELFCYLLLLYESLVCLVRFKKMTIRMIRTSLHLISPCRSFLLQGGEQMISVALQVGRRSIHPWPFWPCWRQVPRSSGALFSNLCEDCDKVTNMSKGRTKDKPLRTDIDMSEIFVSKYTTKVSGQLYRLYSFHATCHVRSCRRTFPWRIKWGTCTGCAWASGVKSWGTQDARIPH